jgi:hypothetical protein
VPFASERSWLLAMSWLPVVVHRGSEEHDASAPACVRMQESMPRRPERQSRRVRELAAGHDTLPEPMREAVIRCFDGNEGSLTGVFEQAEAGGSLNRVLASLARSAPARRK